MIGQGTLPSSRFPIWLQRGIEFGVRHAIGLTLVAILLVLLAMALHLGWHNLFATPDQRGGSTFPQCVETSTPGRFHFAITSPSFRGCRWFGSQEGT